MLTTTIAQSPASIQVPIAKVYEYALTVVDATNNGTQELTAAFTSVPTIEDWHDWLSGWNSCGYSLTAKPVLIRTI